jgi:surfactin synthase thioesterase subunit
MSPHTRIEAREGHIAVGSDVEPVLRVFFFPHAGGSAISLLPLARELPERVESLLFDLPGRGVRDHEPPSSTFDQAHNILTEHVAPLLDRPTILFGHSLGGLLCDAVARSLPHEVSGFLRGVIVSSAPSPRRAAALAASLPTPTPRRDRPDLLERLTGYGGTPSDVFHTPELLESAINAFGDDMLIMDSYCCVPGMPTPGATYEVWTGRDDASTTGDGMEAWADALHRPPHERVFPGGHFYLTGRPEARAALSRITQAHCRIPDQEAAK